MQVVIVKMARYKLTWVRLDWHPLLLGILLPMTKMMVDPTVDDFNPYS